MIKLGVNVDHVATVRQARGGKEPNPLEAAFLCEKGGASSITIHLREDRRHIQDSDLKCLKENLSLPLNLEMALNPEIIELALKLKPAMVTLVPEKREELTTEGGLNVIKKSEEITNVYHKFQKAGIPVSLFIDPDPDQIIASSETGIEIVELHTGDYTNAQTQAARTKEIERLENAAKKACDRHLIVNAGHGLNYQNVQEILHLQGLNDLNIGHSIVSRAIMVGMTQAVREMVNLLQGSS